MPDSPRGFALFSYGFRPFFLLAGAYALVMIPWWMFGYAHGSLSFSGHPPRYRHAHEMIYGFVMAAIAGFLLTAVPSWTGARGFAEAADGSSCTLAGRAHCHGAWLANGRSGCSRLPSLRSFLCSSRCWRRRSFARAIAISHCLGCSWCSGSSMRRFSR